MNRNEITKYAMMLFQKDAQEFMNNGINGF